MGTPNAAGTLLVKTFGFNIPCREFIFSAQVTRDRRMPMVDEFVLRCIYVCENLTFQRLSRFFGFSMNETEIVVADLQARSLLQLNGDEISLHPSAAELFRTSDKNSPLIPSTESFGARIWFELISQSMVASRGLHNVRNLIPLHPTVGKKEMGEAYARDAFNINFRDYLRKLRNVRNPEQWSLYAILDVHAGRFSYAQIAGKEELILGEKPKLQTTLLPTDIDRPSKLGLLTSAMSNALSFLDDPEPAVAGRMDWAKLVGSDEIEKVTRPDGYVDLAEWLRIAQLVRSDQRSNFVGYAYLERNREMLSSVLSKLPLVSGSDTKPIALHWFRPGGTYWGVSEDLSTFLSDVRAYSRKRNPDESMVSTLISPASIQEKTFRNFDRIFDRGWLARPNRMSPTIEALIIGKVCTIVSVQVPIAEGISVPIGRMSINPEDVQRVRERLDPEAGSAEFSIVWTENRSVQRQSVKREKSD